MIDGINVNESLERAIKCLTSNEGTRKLEDNLKAAENASKGLREIGRIPAYLLYEPMTV